MELHQLRCFVAVAEELHFGRAAHRLYMTQPPLSRQIQMLERDLGVQLLTRTNRQVRLTAAGVGFLRDAQRILLFAERAGESARSLAEGGSGRLNVGFTAVAGYRLIPQLVSHLAMALPHVDLVLHEQVTIDQNEALAAQMIDVGFLRQVAERGALKAQRVCREPLLLALPARHPLTAQGEVAIGALEDLPFIMYSPTEGRYFHDSIASLLASAGVRPRFVQHLGQTHSILGLVRAGLGMAMLPASAEHLHVGGVSFRPLMGSTLHADVWMTWREDNSNPALPLFLEQVRAYFRGQQGC